MRATKKAWALLAAGTVLCWFSGAPAQETPRPSSIAIETQKAVTLTPAQMLQKARAVKPSMDNDAAAVQRQATDAKQKHDVVKALCLSDKLSQIHVAVSTAAGRIDTLEAAV